jgi:FixJ family two-component response regulator
MNFLIAIVDDDESYRAATTDLVRSFGYTVEDFPSTLDFLASPHLHSTACLEVLWEDGERIVCRTRRDDPRQSVLIVPTVAERE